MYPAQPYYKSFYVKPEDKKKSIRDKFQKIISEGEKRGKALKVKILYNYSFEATLWTLMSVRLYLCLSVCQV